MPFRSGGSSGGGGSGTVTNVSLAADSGTGGSITTSGTITISGGTGVTTSVSGLDVTVNSSAASNLTTVTKATADSPYTVSSEDVVFCDVSTGNLTINLPSTAVDGRVVRIVDIGSADPSPAFQVTIDGNSSTISGSSSLVLDAGYQSITVVGNGSNYFLL